MPCPGILISQILRISELAVAARDDPARLADFEQSAHVVCAYSGQIKYKERVNLATYMRTAPKVQSSKGFNITCTLVRSYR